MISFLHLPMVRQLILPFLMGISVLALVSCGSGGGGGDSDSDNEDSLNPGSFTLYVSPRSIDTGDRVRVRIVLSDISSEGAILKIRFPANLDYIRNSSKLDLNKTEIDLDPDVVDTSGGLTYVVYFLTEKSLGVANAGELSFLLRGSGPVLDGAIEADIDLDDPQLRPSQKFSVSNPLFETQQDQTIDVIGDSVSGTATPTPVASGTTTPTPATPTPTIPATTTPTPATPTVTATATATTTASPTPA